MTLWQEVGDGCFRRRYESFDLNIGVIRGADAICVFDTRCHAVEADELLADLAELGRPRIRWIVNSHWHFDHTFGNARIRELHPDVEIWGSRTMRTELLELGELARSLWKERRSDLSKELARVEIVPPDHLVDQVAHVDLGDRVVELRYFGRGHTAGDIVALVPDANVVFVGDVVEESAPPAFAQDSFPLEWPASNTALLDRIGADTTVVPGHGDVVDRAFVVRQRDDLATVVSLIEELHRSGVAVDDAIAATGDWPFPVDSLEWAIRRGYEDLERL